MGASESKMCLNLTPDVPSTLCSRSSLCTRGLRHFGHSLAVHLHPNAARVWLKLVEGFFPLGTVKHSVWPEGVVRITTWCVPSLLARFFLSGRRLTTGCSSHVPLHEFSPFSPPSGCLSQLHSFHSTFFLFARDKSVARSAP